MVRLIQSNLPYYVTIACERCGAERVRPRHVIARGEGRFCSRKCANAASKRDGASNTNWRGGRPKPCAVCGTEFWVKPSQWEKRKTCSRACHAQVLRASGKLEGDKNPSWRGGLSFEPYTAEFTPRLKRCIRDRDGRACQLCGVTQENYPRTLAVHHIDYDKANCQPWNLITLCTGCNTKVNSARGWWTLYFQTLLAVRAATTPPGG